MGISKHYLSLVTSEHALQPCFMSMVETLLSHTDSVFDICVDFDDYFDVNLANGAQLDVVGEFVGVGRDANYDRFLGASSILNDYVYRTLLRSKICKNAWKGGIEDLQDSWSELFPEFHIDIHDNQDMTVNVSLIGYADRTVTDLIRRGYIIPKPAGVRMNISASANPLFAYDMNTAALKGYDEGWWATDIEHNPAFGLDVEEEEIRGYDHGYWM